MSYLKLKLQADRTIALNFEKALAQLREETRTASTTVASGIERASWYSPAFLMITKMYVND